MTDLQLRIMRELWATPALSASAVQEALRPQHNLAPTTVSTLLARLVKRGFVAMQREGRQFYYRATVKEQDVTAERMSDLTELLFSGSTPAAVSQLLDSRELTREDLSELKRIIAAKERELKAGQRHE